MNWYRITPCPDYAISEDGLQIKSLKSNKILNHNSSAKAKDGIRRVTLRYTCIYQNVEHILLLFLNNILKKKISYDTLLYFRLC